MVRKVKGMISMIGLKILCRDVVVGAKVESTLDGALEGSKGQSGRRETGK